MKVACCVGADLINNKDKKAELWQTVKMEKGQDEGIIILGDCEITKNKDGKMVRRMKDGREYRIINEEKIKKYNKKLEEINKYSKELDEKS